MAVLVSWGGTRGEVDGIELFQSDLDYLESGEVVVSLSFDEARPWTVLRALAKAGGFEIERKGDFPRDSRLSIEWKEITVRDALTEFAKRYRVAYYSRSPQTLLVDVLDPDTS